MSQTCIENVSEPQRLEAERWNGAEERRVPLSTGDARDVWDHFVERRRSREGALATERDDAGGESRVQLHDRVGEYGGS